MLSKTDFLMFLDAPMHLWAKAHGALEVEVLTAYEQHLVQQGQQVETVAREFIETTLAAQYSHAEVLWQHPFDDGEYKIRADALIHDLNADVYDLYEIKSSTSVQTKHEYDMTFQVLLLETLLPLRHVSILHIDKNYRHQIKMETAGFFSVEDVSDKVEKRRSDVDEWRRAARAIMEMDKPEPSFACTRPRTCPCLSLCHPDLPNHPIYEIPYIGKKAVQLREMGITAIAEIPSTFNLNPKQRKHYQAAKSGKPLIDNQAIRDTLSRLQFPFYFLDYETFNPAVPLFNGYRPYEHIVFQYSLFVIQNPDDEPLHYDCLLVGPEDPAPKIVPHLLRNIGEKGSVIVWNQSFEKGRNLDLADHCPAFSNQLLGINERLYDLMLIFREGHYVHPDFHGSASLKVVLPVLCPDLGYEELAISNGEEAMLTWARIQHGEISAEQHPEIEVAMREYCKRDTFGMVAIWEQLRKL